MSFADFKLIGLNRFPTSLYMWGDNTNGLLGDSNAPSYFSWSKISSGGLHTVAIRSDGLLFAWGRNTEGQLGDTTTVHRSSPVQLSASISWSAVSAGLSHTVAIKGDSTLWAWGNNRYGQLGLGDTANRSSPVQVGTSSWSIISAGGNHSIGIEIDNSVFTWGWNGSGQLGDTTIANRSSPVQLGSNSWLNVSAGKTHTVALAVDYTLYAWGDNTYGELGDGTTINRSSPTQIGSSSWSQISAGGTHTVGIESDGSLMAWGYNNYGQLGLNTSYSGTYWTKVSEGPTHTLAIRNDGALFAWGRNQLGQLGLNDIIDRSSPVQIGTDFWTNIDAGNSHSVAVRSDGKLFTWGSNDWGQLGNNLAVTVVNYNIAWSKIVTSSSGAHTLAIKNDGTLWGWGDQGTEGRIGDGTTTRKSSPTQIGSLNTWIDVAVGSAHSMGITNDNVLYTWGSSTFGQLGDGTASGKTSPVVVGFNYKKVFAGYQTSIAIDNNNLTYIWGDNTNGIIPGAIVGTHRSTISTLNSDTAWSSFAIDQHILGIKNDGTLWAWGLANAGQLGLNDLINRSSPVQVGTSSWSQVSAGLSYSVGITTDNSLYAWGFNSSGQLGLGDTQNRSTPATVGTAGGLSDPNAHSLYFNGSSTYLTIPKEAITMSASGSSTNPTFTVECWYYRSGSGYHSILATSGSTAPTFNFMVDNTRNISLNVGGTQTVSATALSLNKWYHIALTRQPTGTGNYANFNVYLDGVLNFTMLDSDPMRNVEPYKIGDDFSHGAAQYLIGYISNYRISNKIVYTGNFTVPTNSLLLTQSADTNIEPLASEDVTFLTAQTTTVSPPIDSSINAYTITVNGTLAYSQLTPFTTAISTGSTIATQVIAGAAHTLMINSAGGLYTWGLNNAGQLGDNTVVAKSSPIQLGTDFYNFILAGNSYSTAIRSTDSALFTWGLGTFGQLGDITALSKSSPVQIGTTLANQSSPVQIGNSSYTAVSAGEGHTLSLGSDGILYGWGKNDYGQIGGHSNTLGIGWSKIVVGPTHTLGIRFDGTLYAWGNNASGQLGDRTIVAKSSPVVIDSVNNWKDIAVGQGSQQFSMAIRTDGKLYAWGNNQGGQLGWLSWRQLSVGTGHSLLLRSDGALYTMGTNTAGQLGDATTVNKSSPILIGTSSWNFINAGVSVSAAIDTRGRLFTWGYNNVGQLGLATTANRSSPVQVSAGSWSQVASEDYMLAITTQGSIWSWGNNNNGQLGLVTTVNSKVPKLLDGTTTSYSIGFDGIGDYFTLGGQSDFAFGTGNFTVEMWVYTNTLAAVQILYDTNLSGDAIGTGRFELQISTAGVIQLISGAGVTQTQGGVISIGTWNHIAVTRASTSTRIFLNGIQVNTTFNDTINYTNNTNRPIIGSNGFTVGNLLFGYISNLRVVKGQALYTSRFTPTTSPLTTTSQGISSGTVSLLTAQDATIIDNSSNGFTITSGGTPATTQYNPFSVISSTSSTSWTRVAAGTHSLAIRSDSTLYSWGQNNYGQLGDSTTINKSSPIQIGTSSWSLVSASMTGHSLGVEVDGSLFAWGSNTFGELGLNNEFISVSSPTQVGTYSYTSVSAGYNSSLAISLNGINNVLYGWGLNSVNQLNNISPFVWAGIQSVAGIQASVGSTVGKLYLWGDNTYGQLGDNTLAARSSPTQLGGFYGASNYKLVVNTPLNTAYLNTDNILFIIGDNTYGQLGQNDTISRSSPVQVGAGTWSTVVVSGTGHVLGISSNGTLFAWGRNDYNELGQSDSVVYNRSSPVNIGTNADWTKVSAGNNYSLAINSIGEMYTWGRNDFGQLGTAVPLSYVNIGSGIVSRNDGKLFTWGINDKGQLGNNTGGSIAAYRSAPTQIDSVAFASTSWTSVSGSSNNKASIKIDGKLFVWGDNSYGQLGVSEDPITNPSRSQPVQILGSWTQLYVNTDNIFAIRNDSTLWAWGNNNLGQLGTGDTANYSSPVQIGSDSWSMVVASGTGHTIALKSDGTLFAWGNNQYNELGQNQRVQITYSSPVQVGTSSWTKVSAGNNNSFAIRTDGSLWGWGRNEYGQIGSNNNTPLSWTQVAGGDSYSVAIRSDGKLYSWGRNDKGQLGLGHTVNKSAPTQIAVSTNYNYYSTFFNGSSDYLSVPNNAAFALGAGDFTVECWFYTNTITAAQNHIFDTRTSATGSTNPNLYMVNASMQWLINGTSILTGTIPLTTWTHIAVVKRSGTIAMYINGISTSSVADSVTYTSAQFQIGKAWDGFYCNGYISNFRMVKGTAVYTGNFAVPTTPLTNIANTSLLTCQNNIFIDNGTANTGNTPFTITQNGTGITTSTLTPFLQTVYNYSWTQVSATLSHTVAIRNDGTLWAWGANNGGQLGQGDTTTRSAPIQIGTSTDNSWSVVSAGSDASFAIRNDRALFGWGDNTNGLLGQNDTVSRSSPLQIGTDSWTNISARQHILATTDTNTLFTWGLNSAGQLGNGPGAGDTINRSSPVQVGTSLWNLISAGTSFSMATLNTTGVLFTWGLDNAGQLGGPGNGTTTASSRISRSSPSQVGASSWSAIAAGESWASGISAFRLFTWGFGTQGQLGGSSTVAVTASRSSPIQVGAAGSSFTSVSAGIVSGQATTISGALWSWGKNDAGQIGDNTTVNRSAPVQTASLTGQVLDNVSSPTQIGTSSWTQIAGGDLFAAGINTIGQLFTWGYGINGRLGSGFTVSRSSPVQVGTSSWIAISTGGTENTVALTIAYTLFSWGKNNVGQVGDATTVDKSTPTAVGAVLNTNLMTSVIKTVTKIGNSSWTQVSAGDLHAYALRSDNTLWSWGKNDQGQLGQNIGLTTHRSSPAQVNAGTSYTAISAGYSFGAVITSVGALQTAGLNNNGQLGTGTVVSRANFAVIGLSSWTSVSAGASSMIGTTISNTTFVWGTNTSGQLGLVDTINRSAPTQLGSSLATSMYQTVYPSPVIVNTFTTASWTQVNVGNSFSVGLDNSGRLYAWGLNNTGQLGDGTTINTMPTKSSPSQIATTASSFVFINTSSPVQVSAGTSWNAVTAGGTHTVAIQSNGTLWAWGINTFGQIGSGSTIAQYIPKQVDILNSFTSIAAGTDFTVAINQDSTLWRWGYNSTTDITSPHRSNALQIGADSWNFISAGGNTAAAINSLGALYGWGRTSTDDGFAFNLAINPITWATGSSYTSVNAGDSFIHALDTTYGLWGYGLNNNGQLGDNTTVTRSSPVQIGSVYRWSILGSGINVTPLHAGALYMTGLNTSGQLGLGDTASRSSPVQLPATNQPLFNFPVRIGISRWSQISAGYSHSVAIRDDSTLWAWGLNTSGQVGDISNVSRSSPVQIGTSSWIAISAGKDHTGGVKLDNTLWTWGLNTRGQLGDSTTTNRSSPVQVAGYWNNVSVGASHTTALAENNTLYVWGDDNFGQ